MTELRTEDFTLKCWGADENFYASITFNDKRHPTYTRISSTEQKAVRGVMDAFSESVISDYQKEKRNQAGEKK